MKPQIRQGDVLLVPIENIPVDAKREPNVSTRIILAEGEATGHSHTVSSRRAKVYRVGTPTGDHRFLRVPSRALLRHQEHDPLAIPAGDYLIVPQHEYVPGEIRRVAD